MMIERTGSKGASKGAWIAAVAAAMLIAAVPIAPLPAAVVKAYKRDPMPIFDDAGNRLRTVPRKGLPDPGGKGVPVVRAKEGYIGIMLDGQLAWLRMSMIDYAGDAAKVECDAMAMKFASMEEESVEQSLGLACANK